MSATRILYCHCAFARIISDEVKNEVLTRLASSGAAFEAVADLCELAAKRDPSLGRLANQGGELRIAACFPRAVKWLFSAAGAPLPETGVEVRNMRVESAEETLSGLLDGGAGESGSVSDGGGREE